MIDPDAFHESGYARPFRVVDERRIGWYREEIDRALGREGPDARSAFQSRHLDVPAILDLCTAPSVLERVHAVLGPDIWLWRSHFFPKEPGAAELDWHRDCDVWGALLDPMINVTAWIAIDAASQENGCVEVRAHSQSTGGVPIELSAGESFLFDQALLHRSGANTSARRRLGLAARFTLADVRIDRSRLFPGYRPIPLTRAQT